MDFASDIGAGHVNELTTEFESHAQTYQNVSSSSTSSSSLTSQGQRQSFSVSSTTNQHKVHSALRRAFPTFGNAKGVFKSVRNKHDHNSSSKAKGKEPKCRKTRNSVLYKELVFLPMPTENTVPTNYS